MQKIILILLVLAIITTLFFIYARPEAENKMTDTGLVQGDPASENENSVMDRIEEAIEVELAKS